MQTKILNFQDALSLSIILGKYITKLPDKDSNVIDFYDSIFQKITPVDFKQSIEILTGEKLTKEFSGDTLLKVFDEGLSKNKFLTLMHSIREIGFR